MNLAIMPFASSGPEQTLSNQSEISGIHGHCEKLQNSSQSSADIKLNKSIDHFCCSIFAVIPDTTTVSIPHQENNYLIRPLDEKISHIENSIYKPPKPLFT